MITSRIIYQYGIIFFILINSTFFIKSQKKIPPEKPKIVIGIIVEQMRYDYIERYWDKFGEDGFKKLINEGSFFKNANYNYLLTQSASGYATISTGALPSHHGIVSNSWFLRLKRKMQFCTYDSKNYGVGGYIDFGKQSPRQIIGSTIGDELRISNFKKSKVFGISLKNYAAILSAGHLANAAFWFDEKTGNWMTSDYYMKSLPNWVNVFNSKKIQDVYIKKEWNTLLPISKYTESLPDNNSYEIGFNNKITFPYILSELSDEKAPYKILKYSPFGNTLTKDFAIATIVNEKLGKDKYTDYITISFAANGYISDIFGIRSVEIEDTYLRLDKNIAHFLKFVDSYIGKENVLIYLCSDHGASDSPEFLKDIKMPYGTLNYNMSISLLESYLKALYGRANWIKAYKDQQLYLNQILIEESKLSLYDVQLKAAQFLTQVSGISTAATSTTLQTTNFTKGILEKIQNSYNQERSGDILINLSPGWIEHSKTQKKRIINKQNSAYRYDTHVPLVWYGWKMKRISIGKPVNIVDISPTIANLLNISFPNQADGKPILELTE